jgi:nucleoid DNA-binding protein/nucleoid-associated protein YgaU
MGERINIQNLIDLLAAKKGLSKKDAETFLKEMFAVIEQALQTDKYVKIKGLGTFKLIEVDSRESVNVNTGARIEIQGHTKVSFAPEASIRDLINKPFAHFETVILNEGVVFDDISSSDENADNENESGSFAEEELVPEKANQVIEEVITPVEVLENITKESDVKEEDKYPVEEIVQASEEVVSIPEPFVAKIEDLKVTDKEEENAAQNNEPDNANKQTENVIPSAPSVESVISNTEDAKKPEPISIAETPEVRESTQPSEASVETKYQPSQNSSSEVIPKAPEADQETEESANKKALIDELILAARTEKTTHNYSGGKYSIIYFVSMVIFLAIFVGAVFVFIYNPDYILNILPESSENKTDSVMVDANKEKIDTFALTHPAPTRSREEIKRDLARIDSINALTSGTNSEKENKQEADNKQESGDIKKVALEKKDPNDYKIVGTIETYTVKKGESLVRISQHYYNAKDLWTLIVKHNSTVITNPDNVPAGTVLKIPKLSSKQ